MTESSDLQTNEDVIRWAIAHDERINIYWRNQHAWNLDTEKKCAASRRENEKKLKDMQKEIDTMAKKFVWVAGLAAGVGATTSIIGMQIVMTLFNGGV